MESGRRIEVVLRLVIPYGDEVGQVVDRLEDSAKELELVGVTSVLDDVPGVDDEVDRIRLVELGHSRHEILPLPIRERPLVPEDRVADVGGIFRDDRLDLRPVEWSEGEVRAIRPRPRCVPWPREPERAPREEDEEKPHGAPPDRPVSRLPVHLPPSLG